MVARYDRGDLAAPVEIQEYFSDAPESVVAVEVDEHGETWVVAKGVIF